MDSHRKRLNLAGVVGMLGLGGGILDTPAPRQRPARSYDTVKKKRRRKMARASRRHNRHQRRSQRR